MKTKKLKKTFFLLTLILLTHFAGAQQKQIAGSWLMTQAKVSGEVQQPFFVMEFRSDGLMLMSGYEVGKWTHNTDQQTLTFESEQFAEMNGVNHIEKLTESTLIVSKEQDAYTFKKIDLPQIIADNEKSGLTGLWSFQNVPYPGSETLISLEKPDNFSMVQKQENMVSNLNGSWIFDPGKQTLILIGLRGEDFLRGENKLGLIEQETFNISFNGQSFTANRKPQDTKPVERLLFNEDEFYAEDGMFDYEAASQNLPWNDWDTKIISLLNVNQLVYTFSARISGTKAFDEKVLKADVTASLEEAAFQIDYIFNGYDRYQLPEDQDLPMNEVLFDPLYPLQLPVFRIVGNEQITVPAGSFDCTVVEAFNENNVAQKLWLINDKPGIYAKIIEDDPDPNFGHYHVYLLNEIILKQQ